MTSVTGRLYAPLLAILGVGLLAGGLILDRDSRSITTRILKREAAGALRLLEIHAPRAAVLAGDAAAVDAWCDRMGSAIGHRVAIVDPAGRVLGDSQVPLDSIPLLDNRRDLSEIRAALGAADGEVPGAAWSVRRRLFTMAAPLALDAAKSRAPGPAAGASRGARGRTAALLLSIPVTSEHELGRQWQSHLWITIVGVLAASTAGAFVLGRRLGRRLLALRRSAEALGGGALGTRARVESHDDLGALARVLNSMAERLESQLNEVRAERDLREAVLGSLGQGLALLDQDLTIRHANNRFWDFAGVDRPPESEPRLSAARQPELEAIAEEAIAQGRTLVSEIPLYVGQRREYEVSVRPVGERSGRDAWLLSIESLRPEREMANLRREFVANASHELKTPLTSIRGYAETLLQGGLEDEANRVRFVETIRDQAARLEALVEDLLQLADLDRPDAALDPKHWDLADIVRELAGRFEHLALRRGLSLDLEMRPGTRALVDRKRIELALGNLLDNAIKYTERGGVRIRLETRPDAIRVAVTDTGRGIEAQHLPRLFERFYRVDRGRSRELGGTGLGLSIVKHAIQLHGGTVGVESVPGAGSTFWFEIPPDGPPRPAG